MMINDNLKSVIEKLELISDLSKEKEHLQKQLHSKETKFNSTKNAILNTTTQKIERYQTSLEAGLEARVPIPKLNVLFHIPYEFCALPEAPAKTALLGLGTLSCLLLALLFTSFFDNGIGVFIGVVLCFATIALGFSWFLALDRRESIEKYFEWKIDEDRWLSMANSVDFNAEKRCFYEKCISYDVAFSDMVNECTKEGERLIGDALLAIEEHERTFCAQKSIIQDKITTTEHRLDKIGILDKDYYDLSGELSHLLKSGRADTLKEALHMALEEKRKLEEAEALAEQELEYQMEMERIAEEQAYEARRHYEKMERIAGEQAADTRRHYEAMEKEQKAADLRAQTQASMEKSKKHRAYLKARNDYNHAAMQYESYSKQGLTQDALRWKKHMDEAYAEMLRNG